MDKERIAKKIDDLDVFIERIQSLRVSSFEEYKRSLKDRMACERAMQVALEVMIDIAYLLVKELNLGVPADEDAVFEKLKQKKVLSNVMADTAKKMKGFRNILVHKYGDIDDKEVFENLAHLSDFETFKQEVVRFLVDYKQKSDKNSAKNKEINSETTKSLQ